MKAPSREDGSVLVIGLLLLALLSLLGATAAGTAALEWRMTAATVQRARALARAEIALRSALAGDALLQRARDTGAPATWPGSGPMLRVRARYLGRTPPPAAGGAATEYYEVSASAVVPRGTTVAVVQGVARPVGAAEWRRVYWYER